MKVAIINYGMGNLKSVYNALKMLGSDVYIAEHYGDLDTASKIVLPGVGSFAQGMKNLENMGWVEEMEKQVKGKGKIFLGICLGMQLLGTTGTEHGLTEGLNWINGAIKKMESSYSEFRVPHIGWNDVYFNKKQGLFKTLGESKDFYFVHSYALYSDSDKATSGICDYFGEFVASVELNNIYGTQFHPEKSHKAGLTVLENFLNLKG